MSSGSKSTAQISALDGGMRSEFNHGVNQTSVALWIAFNLIPMTLTPQDVD